VTNKERSRLAGDFTWFIHCFSYPLYQPRDWLGKAALRWPILWRVQRKTFHWIHLRCFITAHWLRRTVTGLLAAT